MISSFSFSFSSRAWLKVLSGHHVKKWERLWSLDVSCACVLLLVLLTDCSG
jgi:hypothetical protein